MRDEEIAHLIGFSVAMVEAVAGARRGGLGGQAERRWPARES